MIETKNNFLDSINKIAKDRSFRPTQFRSHSVPNKDRKAYINNELFGLFLRLITTSSLNLKIQKLQYFSLFSLVTNIQFLKYNCACNTCKFPPVLDFCFNQFPLDAE